MKNLILLPVCLVLLAACSTAPYHAPDETALTVSTHRVDLGDSERVKEILKQQYNDWHTVRHKMGGTSMRGVDCSGLVYQTYRTRFGIDMPRSTEYQARMGTTIKKDRLRTGDLVFFKTGLFTRHVGIYIDNGEFLHVSSSNGVTISDLEDSYWKRTYWKAQRIR